MNYLKIKDLKLRKKFKKLELKLKLQKFIRNNILSYLFYHQFVALHSLAGFEILKKKRKRISNKFINRCILTNRSKSIRKLKISRIKARELMSFGIIPGFKKGIW